MIIYGVLSNVSIGKLFIGGILPGILLASLYAGYIMVVSFFNPSIMPSVKPKYTFKEYLDSIKELIPVFLLIFVILGSIYGGFATPTEAAALGVVGSIIIALYFKSFSYAIFKEAMLSAIKTTVMISFIIAGAGFLSQVVAFLGIARAISEYITQLGLSAYMLILVVGLMYIILGMILDGISIVVMTLPIVLPIVTLAGFDPLWFGIFLVLMVELSQITPPVGFSLFVIQSISGEKIDYILKATFPFFMLTIAAVVIVTLFPEIVFYLPERMFG